MYGLIVFLLCQTRYQDQLKEMQSQSDDTVEMPTPVDGATKLSLWKEVAGGKTRGHCYGTGLLSSQIQPGVSSLTQESHGPSDTCHNQYEQRVEVARQEAAEAKAAALRAEEALQEVLFQMK